MRKSFDKLNDYELVKQCIKKDKKAYKSLYDKFSRKMFSICLRYSSDYHSAEDILQEGFTKVYKNLSKFRFEGSFEGWLRRIIVNTAIEHYRKNVHMYPIMDVGNTEQEKIYDHVLEKLEANDILEMIKNLSPGYQTVFNLYVIEGYPHKEISKMLSISEGTSKSQLARARYLLQKMILNLDQSYREAYAK